MKHTRLFAKITAVAAVAAVLFTSAVFLFACNKQKATIGDIFKSSTSESEFTGSKKEFTLPVGWEVYTSSANSSTSTAYTANSDVGYVKSLDAFVVVHTETKLLSIVKCGNKTVYFEDGMEGMLFPQYLGITALRVKDGLIACKFNDGTAGVFDSEANTVVSRTNLKNNIGNANIDNVIRILDRGLIAVHATYDKFGNTGYTSIYRPTYGGGVSERGELVCRVANNDNALSHVKGFDGKYVTVVGNKSGDGIYRIPQTANGNPKNVSSTSNGTVSGDGQDDYYSEITYIGNGRFFIHEDWTVASSEEYTYYDGFDYFVFSRHIYTPDNDVLSAYTANSDKVFAYLSNNYYDSSKSGIDTRDYLNDGFIYASYGLSIENKVGFYDQYILDSNLNVVMSLTGNYGITIKDQKKEKVGVFDLVMTQVDGMYYVPVAPSEVNVYDAKGNLVGHNDRSNVLQQELSNNVIVAGIENPDDKDEILYGAFNVYGEEIIPFNYTSLSAYRGAYTIGERLEENTKTMYILGVDGKEVTALSDGSEPLKDMATNSRGKAIYKIGCYMYQVKSEDGKTSYFGIKNFNPNVEKNVVMSATMATGSVLYAPSTSPSDVFVFEKITSGSNVTYTVYRLI